MEQILGLIILLLDIVAIVSVLRSSHTTMKKILWILAIIVLPVIGMALYFILNRDHALPAAR
jgi:hypothetical protein